MTKEQILKHLNAVEWTEDLLERLENAVAAYVVYNKDPDDGHAYFRAYHISEADARADFEGRNFVPAGCWCYAVLSSLHTDDLYETRRVCIEGDWK